MARNNLGDIVELRADRSLLNPHFDHYLLSKRSAQLHKVDLPTNAYFTSPSNVQFGYQHAKLFSRIERLVLDLFNSSDNEDRLYTFLQNGVLVKAVYKPTNGNFVSVTEVASLSLPPNRSDAFPPSLVFSDIDCALVSNGVGRLTVYNTKNRAQNEEWEPLVSYVILLDEESDTVAIAPSSDSTTVSGLPFLVTDARRKEDGHLSVLLESITEKKRARTTAENAEHPLEKSPFFSRLIWLDLDSVNNSVVRTRELHFNAHLELATLNHNATEIVTVGPTNPVFTFDSRIPIENSDSMEVDVKQVTAELDEKPVYLWTQDAEEITVTIALAESINRADVNYNLTSQGIDLEIKGVKILSGQLEGTVHLDSSTWTIHDKSLQITLFKARGHFWRELVVGDKRGLYQPDPQLTTNALDSLEKFTSDSQATSTSGAQSAFNSEQLEECDNTGEETTFICWTDGNKHNCIQSMDASCSQFLFETRIKAGGPKAIATRQDNDGILWSLNEGDLAPGKRIVHQATMDAFGYVQAGHAQKMFTSCSPNGSYAVVIHAAHHVFIYLQNVPVGNGCELTNRKTRKQYQEVKEQFVVNVAGIFEQNDSLNTNFIGFSISNSVLYLLTRGGIVACHVKV